MMMDDSIKENKDLFFRVSQQVFYDAGQQLAAPMYPSNFGAIHIIYQKSLVGWSSRFHRSIPTSSVTHPIRQKVTGARVLDITHD